MDGRAGITEAARQGELSARPAGGWRSEAEPGIHWLDGTPGYGTALFVPRELADPVPLVVLLHGAGGAPAGIIPFLQLEAEARGVLLLAPKSGDATWDVIRGGFGPDVAAIDEALGEVLDRFPVAAERLVIAGFSDGASYALSIGLINGTLFRRVLAFSPGFLVAPSRAGRPSVFVSHGVDDPVLPIDRCSRRLVPVLEQEGYEVDYREFPGRHEVPAAMVAAALDPVAPRLDGR